MSDVSLIDDEEYLDRMRLSRDGSSVLKLGLLSLRAQAPHLAILVFEGDDDRVVYAQWIRRLAENFEYESMTCKGKQKVLTLKESVNLDKNNLSSNVYFLVDRDFDESPVSSSEKNLYVTTAYAIDNWLINEAVLDDLLKIEFRCALPKVRENVVNKFQTVYSDFLIATKELNRRLFAARNLGVALVRPLPDAINRLVVVELHKVTRSEIADEVIVDTVRPLTSEEIASVAKLFDSLEPKLGYRGKFAMLFFRKWLERLAADRSAKKSDLFGGLDQDIKVRHSEINYSMLASKSPIPTCFRTFFSEVICGAV